VGGYSSGNDPATVDPGVAKQTCPGMIKVGQTVECSTLPTPGQARFPAGGSAAADGKHYPHGRFAGQVQAPPVGCVPSTLRPSLAKPFEGSKKEPQPHQRRP